MPGMPDPAAKIKQFGPTVGRLVGLLTPHRGTVWVILALGVISVALSVTVPLLLGEATDVIFNGVIERFEGVPGGGVEFGALGTVLAWALGMYLASALFGVVQGRLVNRVVQPVMYRMRSDVEDKLHRLPLRHTDNQPRGDLLSRVTNDIDNVSTALQQTISQLLTSILTVVGVLVMMLMISPLLTLIAVLALPLSGVAAAVFGGKAQKRHSAQWRHTGLLNAHVEESLSGHQIVRVYGRQAEAVDEFRLRNEEVYKATLGAQVLSGLIMPAIQAVSNLGYVVLAVLGGLRIASGTMSLGDVQAFIQYSRQFTQPLTQMAGMAGVIQSGVASAERVFELLDAEEQEPDPANVVPPAPVRRGRVEFERVSFSYDPDQPLIENLSLVAEPGQTVAIVGPTGAGKTTLVNLIMRFYEPESGRITLDGVDITTMRRADLRAQTGMVLQDTWLFGSTIRDNIAYGRPNATYAEIEAAARATCVDRFVRTLPHGYDTVLTEDNTAISAGEKQLLTIARAFLANPALLILDEATSSVDTRTEALVRKATEALRASRTSFLIAHRLSTIRDADLILVMENGRIVEQGTHQALLSRRGAYHRLYSTQFTAPVS
ncbi:multidrug ABC transporter ATP-binding protein [Actinophytocola xinjiangensis]|uniref:Fatty acid ABC transporter ATP-binding/permease protein n=2 Tax=Actinophytocola xinjiangensis TaxID=485602 RepID=A0A7Z1AWG0_9PSEU|nr:ABC transporter ATP-binding protein [Actinophytocola xinjiangensis]OLF06864.1 multidrug ABC transporter ATP-binding protein [Actinophytocola xinjiangensis]